MVLANYQNFEKISEYILQSERRKIEEVESFFSFIFENGQLRYLYMRHTWRTLHDTMIEISFRVGTLKYVPLLVLRNVSLYNMESFLVQRNFLLKSLIVFSVNRYVI